MYYTDTPYSEHLDLTDVNRSGQGHCVAHSDNPHHDTLVEHGWTYSHTTPITGLDSVRFAMHTYRLPGTDWCVSVECRDGWRCNAGRLGSGRNTVLSGGDVRRWVIRRSRKAVTA